MSRKTAISLFVNLALAGVTSISFAAESTPSDSGKTLETMTVTASADASAEGLAEAYPGGQVATAGRAGILGNLDYMDSPFSITSYTNELIQDRQARGVGDVLQNDPGVRVARGFGNFQESFFIRGFILGSDDIAYNGLYSLLPRQYIATELFERVEVLRGASAFLMGASPSGGGIGGSINLVPKRAPNEDLNRITVGTDHFEQGYASADIARRFGEQKQFGVRVNAAYRDGSTAVDDEKTELGLFSVGLDWRGDRARLSADIGWQDNQLDETRTNVTLSGPGVTAIPSAPDSDSNWAQPWTYSDEDDVFGTLRGEYDFTDSITGWAAYGMRRTDEANSLANITVTNSNTGAARAQRFDNTREDDIDTGELGLRGSFETGAIGHDWVISASFFERETKNAFAGFDGNNVLLTNLYNPQYYARPDFSSASFIGNDLRSPALNQRTELESYAIGDTLSLFDDNLKITVGIRRQTIESTNFAYNTFTETRYKETENTPVAGVVLNLTPSWSVYGNYIENLRQGDTAPQTTTINGSAVSLTNGGQQQSPYVAVQKEVGIRFDGGELGGNLSFFTTDKPRSYTDVSNPAAPVFTTSGEDRHQGVELTSFGMLTDTIKLLGGVTWLDAEQRDTGNPQLDGNDVIGVPEWQANIGAEWEVPFLQGLALDGRVVYTGSRYADAANQLELSSWTRLDVGARYLAEVNGKVLTLRARVHNLFDRDYWASAGGFENNGYLVLGTPRTLTLSATLDF
ncbi:Ferrichrome-iron receptor [Methylophaga frappieri]|uniref:Ferrichrome-iron receptor n=1 Tax=Methylophaga frappieri (strain ATCC BAA-2434 / DSM 25690 / JAM7) TaxID=754477 RepID=I1YJB0_METFJ|nr:TonB-dependent siderophore receptor [Methylophaga frappieri]AFJ03003.1 Ferrichrome-iron receptor [Methylophaga frappieri]